jgi:hypothetical protein
VIVKLDLSRYATSYGWAWTAKVTLDTMSAGAGEITLNLSDDAISKIANIVDADVEKSLKKILYIQEEEDA